MVCAKNEDVARIATIDGNCKIVDSRVAGRTVVGANAVAAAAPARRIETRRIIIVTRKSFFPNDVTNMKPR